MKVGLRVDVDTLRGTRLGVPRLCEILAAHSVKATFFFSVGPDNMGRHLWRLLRPSFIWKMFRTRATSLYGWETLLRGTLWPGPVIGDRQFTVIRAASQAGHEAGLHAWDHHAWQARVDQMGPSDLHRNLNVGVRQLTRILGRPPTCSAAPAWKCNDLVLRAKSQFAFSYNSDCRGESIFFPVVDGERLAQPQIPVTLPTYDEVVGRDGITNVDYNEYMLSLLRPDALNVLTIHAEAEGIVCSEMFDRFVKSAQSTGVSLVPLATLLADSPPTDCGSIVRETIPGREGWVACQAPAAIHGATS